MHRGTYSLVDPEANAGIRREMEMSDTYKAVEVTAPGTLRVVERPVPEPGAGQVRIRVEACGICHTDMFTVTGMRYRNFSENGEPRVSSRFQGDLGFRIAGKVIQRLVDSGVSVRAHQPLMRIDRADFALALVAQDQVVSAARARSDQASADEARYRKLVDSDAISAQSYEQSKASADSARAHLSPAQARPPVPSNQQQN